MGELSPQVTERASPLPEMQQLLSRTLIRRCAPPSPDWGKASAGAAKFPASPKAPLLGELAHEVRLKE